MGERPRRGSVRPGPTYLSWVLPAVGIALGGALAAWLFLSFGYRGPLASTETVAPQAPSSALPQPPAGVVAGQAGSATPAVTGEAEPGRAASALAGEAEPGRAASAVASQAEPGTAAPQAGAEQSGQPSPFAAIAQAPPEPVRRQGLVTHTVAPDEVLWQIADHYDLRPETVLWANDIDDPDLLLVGQQLVIPPQDGVLYTVRSGDRLSD